MQPAPGISDIAHSIQLATAPVFLLSGVGVTLSVLTNRLARIIDRARVLEAALPQATDATVASIRAELDTLSRRALLTYRAIMLSTSCALLICVVIVVLFVHVLIVTDLSKLIVLLFVAALGAFIGALLCFLQEIHIATASRRFGPAPP